MALAHDSAGFLTGATIQDIRRSNDLLNRIQTDVAAIKRAMVNTPPGRGSKPSTSPQIIVNAANEPTIRNTRSVGAGFANQSNQPVVTPFLKKRDSSGRFVSNAKTQNQIIQEPQFQRVILNGLSDRIATVVSASRNGIEDTDPTIKAFNEVAQPMARGYQMLFDRDKDKDSNRWFKRIFGELKLFRKEETAFSRATSQSLDVLEEGQGNQGGEGGKSFLGGLMGSITPWILAGLTTIGATLLTGVTAVLETIFSPIGLVIGAAAVAAWGLFTENGHKFFAEVADKIYAGWTKTTDYLQSKWDDGIKVFTELWEPIAKFFKDKFGMVSDTVSKAANATNAFIKDKTGIDVKQGVKSAGESIKSGINTVQSIPKRLQDRWQEAKSYLADAAQKAGIDPGLLAKIAGFESGFNPEARPTRKDGTRISSAHGLGQFLDSTWVEMVRKHGDKYGVENAGNLSKAEALSLRSNKELQAGLLAEFTKENAEIGRKLGGNNDDANIYALHNLGSGDGPKFLKALRQNPNARVSDILSKRVIAGNRSLYGRGDVTVAEAYQRMGLAMQQGESFANEIRMPTLPNQPATAQVASIPSPSMPMLKKPLAVAEAPQIIIPLASDASRKGMTTTATHSDVGQNVSDRRIAHIVLGGIGMG